MSKHSIYGPSGADRWTTCSASVEAIEDARRRGLIPEESPSSEYADEGTKAHDFADMVAKGKMDINDIERPMRDHVAGYLAECQALVDLISKDVVGGSHCHEQRVPLFYRPEDEGTLDFCSLRPNPECVNFGMDFLDLKYGQGVKVDAFENKQLAIYCFSKIRQIEKAKDKLPDTMPVRLGIYQPRHHSFTGSVDWWCLTLGDLRKFCQEIQDAYELATDPMEATFKPSPKACIFCPIKGICKHRCKTAFQGLGNKANPFDEFENEIEAMPPEIQKVDDGQTIFVSPEQISWIVRHGDEMKKVIDAIVAMETARLEAGGENQGNKLVAGKLGNRTWVDAEAAEKMASNYLNAEERSQPRKFKTAPQIIAALKPHLDPKEPGIKKLSKQARVAFGFDDPEGSKTDPLIHRPEGKAKLVPDDDPRPALTFTKTEDQFDAEEEEDGEEDWA